MKPEQIAALAAAGYTKVEIEAMDAKPVTIESLSAEVKALQAALGAQQSAAIAAASVVTPIKTAEQIIAEVTAEKEMEVK